MRSLYFIISFLIGTLSVQAAPISKCHYSCFEKKYQCNIDKSHIFSPSCDKELAECRLKCESTDGKNLYVSTTLSPFEITF